jgi:hypothetical protein
VLANVSWRALRDQMMMIDAVFDFFCRTQRPALDQEDPDPEREHRAELAEFDAVLRSALGRDLPWDLPPVCAPDQYNRWAMMQMQRSMVVPGSAMNNINSLSQAYQMQGLQARDTEHWHQLAAQALADQQAAQQSLAQQQRFTGAFDSVLRQLFGGR